VILALRALKLGDLLVAVPALRAIQRFWPDQRLVLATSGWLYPIMRLARCGDQLLPVRGLEPLPAVARFPDVAINLHGAGPQSNQILDALRPDRRIGHSGHGWPGPPWLHGVHERERWCRMLTAYGIPANPTDLYLDLPDTASPAPGAVVINPGAAHGSKRWPTTRFAEVARRLATAGNRIALTGTTKELPLAQAVASKAGLDDGTVLTGRTSLPELAALIADASLVVSGDTGTAHLAYAYRTPSVTLFGPVPANEWGPPPGPHVTLSADRLRRAEPLADEPDPALLGVHPDAVLAAASTLIEASQGADGPCGCSSGWRR
jgi:ADP-heptose:LPS heptosyltransferase